MKTLRPWSPLVLALVTAGVALAETPRAARADEPAAPAVPPEAPPPEAPAPAPPASSPATPTPAPPSSPSEDTGEDVEPPDVDPATAESRAHHRRALALYDEGDYRLALVEFERAYAIGKSYKVLYNIGQVAFQIADWAKARVALEQYLALGGDRIKPERRASVERDLATLRLRTATLTVHANVPGAEVRVDEETLGTAPVEAAIVDAGVLHVRASRSGYTPASREITLAGGDKLTVELALTPAPKPEIVVTHTTTGLPGAALAGWIVTGVLAAGAVGTGIAANAASSKYESMRLTPISGSPIEARADLGRQRDLVRGLAITTDVLAVSTVIAAGVALYFTLRDKPRAPAPAAASSSGLTRPAAPPALTLGF